MSPESVHPLLTREDSVFAQLLPGGGIRSARHVPSASAAWLAWRLALVTGRPVVVVTDGPRSLDQVFQDLASLTPPGSEGPLYYPAWESLPGHGSPPSPDLVGDRLTTLQRCVQDPPPLLIATCIQAVMQRTPGRRHDGGEVTTLEAGKDIELDALLQDFLDKGYNAESEVLLKGQMALRGGVLDIWPPTSDWPVRIELFGNTVDSLRTFDPVEQRSRDDLKSVTITQAAEGTNLEGTVFDSIPANAIWILHDAQSVAHHAELYDEAIRTANASNVALDSADVTSRLANHPQLHFVIAETPDTHVFAITPLEGLPAVDGDTFRPDILEAERQRFMQVAKDRANAGWTVQFYFATEGARERFDETYGHATEGGGKLELLVGALSEGFIYAPSQQMIVSEADFYGHRKALRGRYDPHSPKPGGTRLSSERIAEWTDIQPGDFVVHVDHGIGKYLGLYQIDFNGTMQEVMTVEYAGKAKLYVPVAQAHLLSKYVGLGRRRPELHGLGGKRWQKEKIAAENAVQDLASLLLETQATRDALPGHAFSPDTHWQQEFEASFPYRETPDQEKAISAVKLDMENTRPMDRLVCGDVGFGKTEVAMRAAFKAVMDGRQVAMLVPTTILAQQHYDTFSTRMAAYPVRIEMLSRFQTRSEQNEILTRVAEGAVDIVIGTHRIVQKDVVFKELGLLIIDEEQRFGVKHKEHFKGMRRLIDVLTLTATPIPRTLYMSLTGARDLSTIQTPPIERMPIETIVAENSDEVVRNAVMNEINREGQVYFLHNRVQTIEKVWERLRRLVPEARIEIGHGQMDEKQLAMIMRAFVRGDFDILLCTTIIESGLDIPNVNTILIDRADRFGLAELYQLRGRVGRYKRKAYAYLLLPKHAQLFDQARRRIGAIRKYSHMGAGFKLALRDLEIRGAGNLLGAEQSGHISSVGFDLYCQLLKRTVARMKGEPLPPIVDIELRLDFIDLAPGSAEGDDSAVIPTRYADDETQRIALYRKLAGAATNAEVDTIRDEMRDRYGRIPPALERLLKIARLRVAASGRRIQKLEVENGKVMATRRNDLVTVGNKFPRLKANTANARLDELIKLVKTL